MAEHQEWEMAIRPIGQAILAAENNAIDGTGCQPESHQNVILNRNVRKRSKFRMAAILTALFVNASFSLQHPLHPVR